LVAVGVGVSVIVGLMVGLKVGLAVAVWVGRGLLVTVAIAGAVGD
jgi:hypothetical protein